MPILSTDPRSSIMTKHLGPARARPTPPAPALMPPAAATIHPPLMASPAMPAAPPPLAAAPMRPAPIMAPPKPIAAAVPGRPAPRPMPTANGLGLGPVGPDELKAVFGNKPRFNPAPRGLADGGTVGGATTNAGPDETVPVDDSMPEISAPSGTGAFNGGASTSGMTAQGGVLDSRGTPNVGPDGMPIPGPFTSGSPGQGSIVPNQGMPSPGAPGAFDATYYLQSNPDVAAAAKAAGGDQNAFALNHWLTYGRTEDRPIDAQEAAAQQNFNPAAYLGANPDVAAAAQTGAGLNPLQHFTDYGFFEGRNPAGMQAVDKQGKPITFTAGGGNSVMPGGTQPPAQTPPATASPISLSDVRQAIADYFTNNPTATNTTSPASSSASSSPAQNAFQVLSSLTPNRSNRFQSNDVAPNFWG